MSRLTNVEEKLQAAFQPDYLSIINESHLHAGHHHHDDGERFDGSGETHFRVRIVSPAFTGQSRLARHRAINETLDEVLKGGLHALAVEAYAPGEATRW
jgi:BolA protein